MSRPSVQRGVPRWSLGKSSEMSESEEEDVSTPTTVQAHNTTLNATQKIQSPDKRVMEESKENVGDKTSTRGNSAEMSETEEAEDVSTPTAVQAHNATFNISTTGKIQTPDKRAKKESKENVGSKTTTVKATPEKASREKLKRLNDDGKSKSVPKEEIEYKDEAIFETQRILGKRTRGRKPDVFYKIQWKGYSAEWDTWERVDNMNCDELVEEFEAAWKNELLEKKLDKASIKDKKKKQPKAGREFEIKERDEDEYEDFCIMCDKGLSPGIKIPSVSSYIRLSPAFSIRVYDGLNLFYAQFLDRTPPPLSALEPIRSSDKENRMLCLECCSGLKQFCNGLKCLVQASHKESLLSDIAGDLEGEKVEICKNYKKGPSKSHSSARDESKK